MRTHFIAVCGKSEGARAPVIRNGQVTRLGEWPWQVSVAHRQEDGQFYGVCGGTVISENWVVTAAHCVTNRSTANIMPLANLKLYLGKYYRDINQDDAEVQVSLVGCQSSVVSGCTSSLSIHRFFLQVQYFSVMIRIPFSLLIRLLRCMFIRTTTPKYWTLTLL